MKRKIVLSESKFRGLVKNIITEILVKKAYGKFYSDIPEDEYNKIANADKTRGSHLGAYAKWLLELYKKNKFDLNNLDKAKKYISVFDRMAQAGQLKGVDINTFDSIDDMYELVKDNLDSDVITKGDKIRKVKETGVERIYEDGEWLVVSPKTHEASCHYGANTKWCTASKERPGYFKEYTKEGPLYILINKRTKRKYQIHFETDFFADETDENINPTLIELPDDLINRITKGDIKKQLQFKYDFVGDFEDGLTRVKLNGKWNFINMDGEILFNQWFDFVGYFENGLAKVDVSGKGWNFINQDGEMLSKQYFNLVGDFEGDFAMVKIVSKGLNFISRNGEILSNQWFDWVGVFEKGIAKVVIHSKGFNFINENGVLLFDQWIDNIGHFQDGFAIININNKGYNFINQSGEILSDQWFYFVRNFKDGFAIVELEGDKHNFINQDGEILFNQWFDVARVFNGGIAKVEMNNKDYKVDLNRKIFNEIN